MSATALREAATKIADEAPPVDVGYAPNVIVALLRVMRDLPGIDKDQTAAAQQGGYAYRGIEQITRHTQGLFARHGVVFSPRVVHHEVRDISVNNKPWTDTVMLVEYDVFGPGGIDDKITIGPILAIGRDNSDKGGNKCMTQAFKYALLQALCISDAKDDADGATHEADAAALTPTGRPRTVSAKSLAKATLLKLCEGDKAKAKEAWAGIGGDQVKWGSDPAAEVEHRWLEWVNEDPAGP